MYTIKMNKVLAATSIAALTAFPFTAFAQDIPPATTNHGQAIVMNEVKKQPVPGTLGQITHFVNDHTGKFITVTGRGLAKTDQSEIILSITKDTKIIDAKGNRVQLKTIIDEHKMVKAFYSPNITKSLPARGTALTLVVQDLHSTAITGQITELRDNSIIVQGADLYTGAEDTIQLHYADRTQMLDQMGNDLPFTDLQVGMSVKAFYGPAVMMSLPPQSTASYISVDTEMQSEQAPEVDAIVTDVTEHAVTIIGQNDQGGVHYVVLTVDEDTVIVDEDGAVLNIDALQSGSHIAATYGPIMALSYPARTHADKIVVKQAQSIRIEGLIGSTELSMKDRVYVHVGADTSVSNDVILNITDDTIIVPMLGGGTELEEGSSIVAYHSPIMTRSLPGITNADIIIVYGK